MAGVTDLPFRETVFCLGAGMVVSEMVSADPRLWHTAKSRMRMEKPSKSGLFSIQIEGSDPVMLGEAARYCQDQGADIVDINMGCPAKKVLKKAAGSALLKDENLVANILDKVVSAVEIPVTLKIRTGWSEANKNGVKISRIAESAGVQAIAVHGRTRNCKFGGSAEYETIRQIKQQVKIPVFANGDICNPEQAASVLDFTKADGVMIGRAALGAPWLLGEIAQQLDGNTPECRSRQNRLLIVLDHLKRIHRFYESFRSVRLARKHIKSYLTKMQFDPHTIGGFLSLDNATDQVNFIQELVTFSSFPKLSEARQNI
ncbi:MAG: tRNA dihydrouridine synthase DusB [Pseudomonadales bacterium]|nr:tRNA dihydrouridine synthase DusB [Pseudomonadales bacterium]